MSVTTNHQAELVNVEQKPDHNQIRSAHRLLNLAQTHQDRAEYSQAEQVYLRALSLIERSCGPDHEEVSTALNNLAVVYKYMGRFAEPGSFTSGHS